jgi:arsenite oxidase small subunit
LKEEITRGSFIRLGAALGVAGVGVSVLSACGESGEQGRAAQAGTAAVSGASSKSTSGDKRAITRAAKLAPGTAIDFTDSGEPAILIHLKDGDFAAYSAVCTHQGCTVGYQAPDDVLVCPCHSSVFDPAHGAQVLQGPAPSPLPKIAVQVRNGQVYAA